MIYNKSTHPVEVKKISIRLWSLRDEIEAAIERRMKECEAAGVPLYIDDIKKFYNLNVEAPLTDQSNVIPLHAGGAAQDGVNSLMESIAEENKAAPAEGTPEAAAPQEAAPEATPPQEAAPEAAPPQEAAPAAAAVEGETSQVPSEASAPASATFSEAEGIIAEQKLQGLDTKKPNPILDRPYQRQVPDTDKLSYGFALLSDIHMDLILCFTKQKFLQGQSVIVEFLIPQNFMMTAEVLYCHHYARTSRIISSVKPDFRVQCKFKFQIPGERDNLRNFLKSIQPTIPEVKKKPKKETSEEDSLGF